MSYSLFTAAKKVLLTALVAGSLITGCAQSSSKQTEISLTQSDSTRYFKYRVQYPAVIRSVPALREALVPYGNKSVEEHQALVDTTLPHSFSYPWELLLDFTVEDSTRRFISILGYEYSYSGGAHGNHFFKTFTYDQQNKQLLQLQDLFADSTGLKPISDYCRQALSDSLMPQSATTKAIQEQQQRLSSWIEEGTAPEFTHFRHFLLAHPRQGRASGLLIYFPPYQVAPYSAGSQEVFVPVSVFRDQLQPKMQTLFVSSDS